MRFSIILVLLGANLIATSQTLQTDQKVISSTGTTLSNSNGTQISYTIGEPVINKGSAGNKIYTHGFQQPNSKLSFSVEVIHASCLGSADGTLMINNISGCNGPFILSVNGEAQTSLSVYGLSAGTYLVELFNSQCNSSSEVTILESDTACALHFFNGFTPNNDGSNDTWKIRNIDVAPFENNSIEIFDRWGGIVWSGKNYDNSLVVFNGTDTKGNELPEGTYFYFAKVDLEEYSGYITLLR